MMVLRVVVALVALTVIFRTVMSAVRTFVVPRAEPTALTRVAFLATRRVFLLLAGRRDAAGRHAIMRLYAPVTLLLLPGLWLAILCGSCGAIYWSLEQPGFVRALELSGSAVTSLGSFRPTDGPANALSFVEASMGLGLVALLITFLPTIYDAYQRREREVSLLAVRAGTPPSAEEMLIRFSRINLLDDTAQLWADWEAWFVDLEESHTSMGSLALFRSGPVEHSWVTAAGAVLDGAALLLSSVDVAFEPRAALCIRSGFLALRGVADFFDISYDPDPAPDDPIAVSREEYDATLARLEADGVALRSDREAAWQSFAGWRVNYDAVLLALCALTLAPTAPWSADRAASFQRPPITRRGGRGRGARSTAQVRR